MLDAAASGTAPGRQDAAPLPVASNWVASLQRFAATRLERCELCGASLPVEHQHLLDLSSRQAVCACLGCVMLLGSRGSGQFVAMPPRAQRLDDFRLSDAEWSALQIPIGLAFLFESTPEGAPLALYPGPAGTTESKLRAEAWATIVAANPCLADMPRDVEALLVNRVKGCRDYYRVSMDRCFVLVALIRKHWRGIHGGDKVWEAVEDFFDGLGAHRRAAHG